MLIINAAAHEWQTLITVLENVYMLSRIAYPVMVTFDMDLYKKALRLEYLDEKYTNRWWL